MLYISESERAYKMEIDMRTSRVYYSYNSRSLSGGEYAKNNVSGYGTKWLIRYNRLGEIVSEKLLLANVSESEVEKKRGHSRDSRDSQANPKPS